VCVCVGGGYSGIYRDNYYTIFACGKHSDALSVVIIRGLRARCSKRVLPVRNKPPPFR